MNLTKVCGDCKLEKFLDQFYKSKNNKYGRSYWCKDCTKIKGKEYNLANDRKIPKVYINKEFKLCSGCNTVKDIEFFYKEKCSIDGRGGYCKLCSTKYHREWVNNNKEVEKTHKRKYYVSEKGKELRRRLNKKKNGTPIQKAREKIVKTNRRLRERGLNPSKFRTPHGKELAKVLAKLPDYCVDCKTINNLTVDHIYPLSKISEDQDLYELAFGASNLTTRCQPCNSRKRDHVNPS